MAKRVSAARKELNQRIKRARDAAKARHPQVAEEDIIVSLFGRELIVDVVNVARYRDVVNVLDAALTTDNEALA